MTTTVKQLKHPYISTNKKIRRGEPCIIGTGIRVLDIAVRYELMGQSPEDIILAYPHITLAQIHDALSYYYEHKSEMDKKWKEAAKKVNALKQKTSSLLEQKLGQIKDIHG